MTVLILLFCLAGPSLAQPQSQSFSLAFHGNFLSNMTFGKLNPLPNTADVPEISVFLENRGISFGLSLGYLITDRFELQGAFTYGLSEIVNDVGIGFAGIPLGKTKVSDAKNLYYSGNVLYYFSRTRTSLFLTGGVGVVTLKASQLRSRTKLFLNYGAGIRFQLSKQLSSFLDIKDYVSFFNYPNDFEVLFAAVYDPDFRKCQHRLGIRFSLSFTI